MKKHELRTLIRSQLKELTSNNNVDCKYLDKNIREVKELYKFFVKIRNNIDSLTNSWDGGVLNVHFRNISKNTYDIEVSCAYTDMTDLKRALKDVFTNEWTVASEDYNNSEDDIEDFYAVVLRIRRDV